MCRTSFTIEATVENMTYQTLVDRLVVVVQMYHKYKFANGSPQQFCFFLSVVQMYRTLIFIFNCKMIKQIIFDRLIAVVQMYHK